MECVGKKGSYSGRGLRRVPEKGLEVNVLRNFVRAFSLAH